MRHRTVERIEELAKFSVGRGCFFAALAIWCVMIGLIADPLQALKAGAILTMLAGCILLLKAQLVMRRSYKKTEVWILLDRKIDLTPEDAQQVIATSLRDAYNRYTWYAALIAAAFWIFALLFWLLRKAPPPV